jgi:hypothetical protein
VPADGPPSPDARTAVLYLAPCVDSDDAGAEILDAFGGLDRERFAASLITTQPSANRRLAEAHAGAEEIWALPDHMPGPQFPGFIFDFIHTRRIDVLQIVDSRLGFDLLPDLVNRPGQPVIVASLTAAGPERDGLLRYVATRYGNLVDAFSVPSADLADALRHCEVAGGSVHVIGDGAAADRATLYDALLAKRASAPPAGGAPTSPSAPPALPTARPESPPARPESQPARPELLRFSGRPSAGTPLVSVITACLNHGRYLPEMVASVWMQDYPAIELVIVDDGSTDSQTNEVLAEIEREGAAKVLREARTSGPGAARNRGIAVAQGRYILPLDADNVLLGHALSGLVEQLQAAGERVGFIYPKFRYFGNRDQLVQPPAYDRFQLLARSFADTCSLLDRSIFDAGLSYPEEIEPGHEGWDLALDLAARDVIGEPSRELVLLNRKRGFTRSEVVDHRDEPYVQRLPAAHPDPSARRRTPV